jgi:hypothetical protein
MVKVEKPTFSLRLLLAVVTLTGLCIAGLINHTPIWASGAVSGTLLILAYGTIRAFYSLPEKRMFWSSFSISSWLYFIVAFCGPFVSIVAPYLITTRVLAIAWRSLGIPMPTSNGPIPMGNISAERYNSYSTYGLYGDSSSREYMEAIESFFFVGHSMFTVLVGFCFAFVCVFLASRRSSSAKKNGSIDWVD